MRGMHARLTYQRQVNEMFVTECLHDANWLIRLLKMF